MHAYALCGSQCRNWISVNFLICKFWMGTTWRIALNFPKFSPTTVSSYKYLHAKQHIGTTVLLPARVKNSWWVVNACLIKHAKITIGLLLVEDAQNTHNLSFLGASNVQIQLPHTSIFSWSKSFVKLLKMIMTWMLISCEENFQKLKSNHKFHDNVVPRNWEL